MDLVSIFQLSCSKTDEMVLIFNKFLPGFIHLLEFYLKYNDCELFHILITFFRVMDL